jgi:hypothetical protein
MTIVPDLVTLVHSLAYTAIFSAYALVTLHLAPRLWLRHFPANERERQPPRNRRERIGFVVHAIVFLAGIMFSLPVLSAWWVYGTGADPDAVFSHIATLGIAAALVDWLVLDWLLIRFLQPAWVIPVGTDPGSWRNIRDIAKDAVGFFPIGTGLAFGWAYVVSRWVLA